MKKEVFAEKRFFLMKKANFSFKIPQIINEQQLFNGWNEHELY